jgi:hypothetical protein
MKLASHWLDQPRNHKILWAGFIVVLAATLVLEWIWPIHAHFGADDLFGFNALYGFLVCAAMIAFAKLLGLWLKRPDTYYDSDEHHE